MTQCCFVQISGGHVPLCGMFCGGEIGPALSNGMFAFARSGPENGAPSGEPLPYCDNNSELQHILGLGENFGRAANVVHDLDRVLQLEADSLCFFCFLFVWCGRGSDACVLV